MHPCIQYDIVSGHCIQYVSSMYHMRVTYYSKCDNFWTSVEKVLLPLNSFTWSFLLYMTPNKGGHSSLCVHCLVRLAINGARGKCVIMCFIGVHTTVLWHVHSFSGERWKLIKLCMEQGICISSNWYFRGWENAPRYIYTENIVPSVISNRQHWLMPYMFISGYLKR